MKSKLISLIILISIFVFSCVESQEINEPVEERKHEQDTNLTYQTAETIPCSDEDEFIAVFSDFENLPTTSDFKELQFEFNDIQRKIYSDFSYYIKNYVYTDASGEEWVLQPVGKYKLNEKDYLFFVAEQEEDTIVIKTISWHTFEHDRERQLFSSGIDVFKRFTDGNSTDFEFVSGNIESLKVYTDIAKKHFIKYTYYFGRFYNLNKLIKITDKSKVPNYSFSEFCSLFPEINNNWNTNKQIELAKNKDLIDFSVFVNKKTSFAKEYVSNPVDFAPIVIPLGHKQIGDSLHLLVFLNNSPDYNQRELNLVLMSGFENIIDQLNVSNNETRTKITCVKDVLNLDIKYENTSNTVKFLLSEEGFLAEKTSFNKYFSKNLKFPYISDSELLSSGSSEIAAFSDPFGFGIEWEFKGRLETNRFYILIFHQGYEITEGFHAYAANSIASLYSKSNLKHIEDIYIYSYFSDAGEESCSIIYPGKIYIQDIIDEKPLNKMPKEEDYSYFLTDEGYFKLKYVIKREHQASFKQDKSFIDLIPETSFPYKYDDTETEISNLNKYFSHVIDSLKFGNENLEEYVIAHNVKGKIKLSETKYLIIWQSWKYISRKYSEREIIPKLEIALYDVGTESLIDVKEADYLKPVTKQFADKTFNINK